MRMQVVCILCLFLAIILGCENDRRISVKSGKYSGINGKVIADLCISDDGTYIQRIGENRNTIAHLEGRWHIEYDYGEPRLWLTNFVSYSGLEEFSNDGNGVLFFGENSLLDGVDGEFVYKYVKGGHCELMN